VHAFSSVVHTMHVEVATVSAPAAAAAAVTAVARGPSAAGHQAATSAWIAHRWISEETGQEAAWMGEKEMAEVGVTSGVRKVLAYVDKQCVE
jgi:hypothetical protein